MSTAVANNIGSNIQYPTSDGRPMAETDLHRDLMLALIEVLRYRFESQPDVYVSGNLLVFYEPGNKRRHVAPDVFVVKGVPKHQRLNYLVWEEGKGPDVVIELTSKTTRREDQTKKRRIYEELLKVPEYFLFDPLGEYLNPALQAFRLVDGKYVPMMPEGGRFRSERLNLDFVQVGAQLHVHESGGPALLTSLEKMKKTEAEMRELRREIRELRSRLQQ